MKGWATALGAGAMLLGCAAVPVERNTTGASDGADKPSTFAPASFDAATRAAEKRLRELASRSSPGGEKLEADLRERYEELLSRPGTPEERKPEILLRLAELAYRDEEAALRGAYESGEPQTPPASRYARSIGYYSRLVEAYPNSPQALMAFYNLGYLCAETGQGAESTRAYGEVLRRDPSTPYADEIHMRLGEAAYEAGELDSAIEHYRAVVQAGKPEYVEKALYKLGWCFFNLERYDKAVDALSGVINRGEASPEDLRRETLEVLAKAFRESGGLKGLAAYVGRDPGAGAYADRLFRLLGELYSDSSRYREAVETYAAGAEARPASAQALAMEKGILASLMILRDQEAANSRRESWIDRYGPGSEWDRVNGRGPLAGERDVLVEEGLRLAALYHHGLSQRGQGGLEKALALYDRYLRAFGSSTGEGYEMAFACAQALKEAGRLREAAAQYRAVALDEARTAHREDASYRRVAVLRDLYAEDPGVLNELSEAHEEYVALNPASSLGAEVLFGEGEILFAADRFAQARGVFDRVASRYPDHPLALQAVARGARCHFREGDYVRAEEWARRALAKGLPPQLADEVRKLLAFSIFKQAEGREGVGDREGAIRGFFRLADELPEEEAAQIALYRAADALRSAGRESEAAKVYERLAKAYRGSRYAVEALGLSAQLFAALGDWSSAAGHYEDLYRINSRDPAAADALFRAGLARERAREAEQAGRLFQEFCDRFPEDSRVAEARYRHGEVLRTAGREREAEARYADAWEAKSSGDASAYRALAALALGKMALAKLQAQELKGDLAQALARKEELLNEALARLAQAASLPFAETLTESLYRAGEAFEHMKEALLGSERPAGLSEEERQEYTFLLEEKAFPLEERAISYYRNGIGAARKAGVHTVWVARMFERLETLVPWAYQRKEEPSLAWDVPALPAKAQAPLTGRAR